MVKKSKRTVTPTVLAQNPDWKYTSVKELKLILWNNAVYSFEHLGSYAGHDFQVANVYPLIRFIYSDEIEAMYDTHNLYKYVGVDKIVQDRSDYADMDEAKKQKTRDMYAHYFSPVWGLKSAGYDHLRYEHDIASFIWRAPNPVFSIKFFGPSTQEQLELPYNHEDKIPCRLVLCDQYRVEEIHYSSSSCHSEFYETSSFAIWSELASGTMSWSTAREMLVHHKLDNSNYSKAVEPYGL